MGFCVLFFVGLSALVHSFPFFDLSVLPEMCISDFICKEIAGPGEIVAGLLAKKVRRDQDPSGIIS